MKMVFRLFLLLSIFVVSGCVPKLAENRPTFSLEPQGDNGRIIVSHEYLHKDDGDLDAKKAALVIGFLIGAPPPNPNFTSKLYDVTDEEPSYIGYVNYPRKYAKSGWLEHIIPAGKRILMLDRSGSFEPEFLEVNIKAGETTHIAIALRGSIAPLAEMDEIQIVKEDYLFCKGLQELDNRTEEERSKNYNYFKAYIDDYMMAHDIPLSIKSFRNYCISLAASAHVNILTQKERDEFEKDKEEVIGYKTKYLAEWQAHPEKQKKPYNIRKVDIKKKETCSEEVRVCSDGTKVMRLKPTCSFEQCPS